MKVGEKVVCKEGYQSNGIVLKTKEIYEVQEISQCGCGEVLFNVGVKPPNETYLGTYCKCGKVVSMFNAFHSSKRFRPIDRQFANNLLESIREESLTSF